MKLHYKIISCTSQDPQNPATNLVSGGGLWQSARFCQYPQQITIQFYEPVTVGSIHIASHASKVPQRVNLLFCLPDKVKLQASPKFEKYGYFQFNDNQSTDYKLRELKKLEQININASYLRLILWKNHQNTQNFFNQVGLSQLTVFGNPYYSTSSLSPVITNKSMLMNLTVQEYIDNKLQLLEQFKQQFSKHDDFESAKQVKQIIKVIKVHGEKLVSLEQEKKMVVTGEDYEKAKQIKLQIDDIKADIQHIANNFYDPNKKLIKPVLKQSKLKVKIDEILSKSGNFNGGQSRSLNKYKKSKVSIFSQQKQVQSDEQNPAKIQEKQPKQEQSHEEQENEQDEEHDQNEMQYSRVSYDNRILPTVLKKSKANTTVQGGTSERGDDPAGYEDNQFMQKQKGKEEEIVLEQMTPSAEANAAVLLELFDKDIVKKLHSKHWSFKLEALNAILDESKKYITSTNELEKNRVKSILFTFNKIIKEGNFQLNMVNLDLLTELVSSKKTASKNVQTDLHAELQKSINEICLKMNDSQKIKQKCAQILQKMLTSEVYGSIFIYNSISKSYFNQNLTNNVKVKKNKLGITQNILDQFGIGSNNGKSLPIGAVDFMCKVAEDSNDEIRKQATAILKKMKTKGAGNRVMEVVRSKQTLKGSIIKELEL